MSYSIDPRTRDSFITDLRALADFLATHPAVPVPLHGAYVTLHATSTETGGRDQVNHIACLLGATISDDTASGGHYRASRSFGSISYDAVAIPEACTAAYHALTSYDGCVTP